MAEPPPGSQASLQRVGPRARGPDLSSTTCRLPSPKCAACALLDGLLPDPTGTDLCLLLVPFHKDLASDTMGAQTLEESGHAQNRPLALGACYRQQCIWESVVTKEWAHRHGRDDTPAATPVPSGMKAVPLCWELYLEPYTAGLISEVRELIQHFPECAALVECKMSLVGDGCIFK